MSRRSFAALLVTGLTGGTIYWLINREQVIFPALMNSTFNAPPGLFRDIGIVAVVAIAVVFLWAIQRGGEAARQRAAVCALLIAGAAVFLAWFHTHTHFFPRQQDEQIKEIVTWATAVCLPALVFRILTAPTGRPARPPQQQPQPQAPNNLGQDP
ncbi:MAG: hypothetical protein IT462_11640 [Planctomycetes bacterium]|nr:hypothetical protein [Planctomycetota bacterium]